MNILSLPKLTTTTEDGGGPHGIAGSSGNFYPFPKIRQQFRGVARKIFSQKCDFPANSPMKSRTSTFLGTLKF
jgi:hypothetical protein